jgi:hypothetical protein
VEGKREGVFLMMRMYQRELEGRHLVGVDGCGIVVLSIAFIGPDQNPTATRTE